MAMENNMVVNRSPGKKVATLIKTPYCGSALALELYTLA
jgi:hypothetical protein